MLHPLPRVNHAPERLVTARTAAKCRVQEMTKPAGSCTVAAPLLTLKMYMDCTGIGLRMPSDLMMPLILSEREKCLNTGSRSCMAAEAEAEAEASFQGFGHSTDEQALELPRR